MSSCIFCPDSCPESASVHSKLPAFSFHVYSGFLALSAVRCHVVYPCRVWIIFEGIYSIFMRKHKYVALKKKTLNKKQEHYLCLRVGPFFKRVLRKVQRECNTEGSFGTANVFSFSRQASLPAGPENSTAVSFSLSTKSKVRASSDGSTGSIKTDFLIHYSKIVCKFSLENTAKDDPCVFFFWLW